MKCKNCGASIENQSGYCGVCGAVNEVEDDGIRFRNYGHTTSKYIGTKKSESKKRFIISSIAVILIFAIGSFAYFYSVNTKKPQPELSFSTGQGIINKDEHIVYAFIKDPSHLEYIHSVNLYEGELNAGSISTAKPVLSNYQYTKSVDEGFRAIFFDLDDLKLSEKGNYTFTFQMTFSFVGDDNWYTYYETVNVTGKTNLDVTKVIFDYSTIEYTTKSNELTTKQDKNSINFVYEGYWYTPPVKVGSEYTIYAIKFKDDNTCVTTRYHKLSNDSWETTTGSGAIAVDKDKKEINVEFDDIDSHKATFKIDVKNKELTLVGAPENENNLTQRKYNSLKNALDFFGM